MSDAKEQTQIPVQPTRRHVNHSEWEFQQLKDIQTVVDSKRIKQETGGIRRGCCTLTISKVSQYQTKIVIYLGIQKKNIKNPAHHLTMGNFSHIHPWNVPYPHCFKPGWGKHLPSCCGVLLQKYNVCGKSELWQVVNKNRQIEANLAIQ